MAHWTRGSVSNFPIEELSTSPLFFLMFNLAILYNLDTAGCDGNYRATEICICIPSESEFQIRNDTYPMDRTNIPQKIKRYLIKGTTIN